METDHRSFNLGSAIRQLKGSLMPSLDSYCFMHCFEMNESICSVIHRRKFSVLNSPSITSFCFKSFEKKLQIFVIFIIQDLVVGCRYKTTWWVGYCWGYFRWKLQVCITRPSAPSGLLVLGGDAQTFQQNALNP